MADNEDGVWRTVGGKKIFIKDGQDLADAMRESGKFKNVKATSNHNKKYYEGRLKEIDSKEDGTYNIETGETKTYNSGYQVTFSTIGMKYNDKEYQKLVEKFKMHDHGVVDAGKFDGYPEISFNVTDYKMAVKLAYKYNQISIYNWKDGECINTGGTGNYE